MLISQYILIKVYTYYYSSSMQIEIAATSLLCDVCIAHLLLCFFPCQKRNFYSDI